MIRLTAVTRRFQVGEQEVLALNAIDLQVQRGEYLSIMGPSGSGKSTLLNMIGLLDRPTRGTYELDGENVTRLSDEAQAKVRLEKIGFVFQFFHLVPRLTAAENVELPLVLAGLPPAARRPKVASALSALGLEDRAAHRPDQLSGGQRQRVAIARATVMEPAVILADEPTGNLDSVSGRLVLDILERLNAQGMALVMVTHDAEIGRRARRQVHMVDGRIVADEASPP